MLPTTNSCSHMEGETESLKKVRRMEREAELLKKVRRNAALSTKFLKRIREEKDLAFLPEPPILAPFPKASKQSLAFRIKKVEYLFPGAIINECDVTEIVSHSLRRQASTIHALFARMRTSQDIKDILDYLRLLKDTDRDRLMQQVGMHGLDDESLEAGLFPCSFPVATIIDKLNKLKNQPCRI